MSDLPLGAQRVIEAIHGMVRHPITAECGRGIGTQVVRALEQRHPSRRLLAYSEEADGFWASLGWEPFHHPDGDWRTLFIQPAT